MQNVSLVHYFNSKIRTEFQLRFRIATFRFNCNKVLEPDNILFCSVWLPLCLPNADVLCLIGEMTSALKVVRINGSRGGSVVPLRAIVRGPVAILAIDLRDLQTLSEGFCCSMDISLRYNALPWSPNFWWRSLGLSRLIEKRVRCTGLRHQRTLKMDLVWRGILWLQKSVSLTVLPGESSTNDGGWSAVGISYLYENAWLALWLLSQFMWIWTYREEIRVALGFDRSHCSRSSRNNRTAV